MKKPISGKRAVTGPKIRLIEIRRRAGWDGYCRDCKRGADGWPCVARGLIQVWCDCPKKRKRKAG